MGLLGTFIHIHYCVLLIFNPLPLSPSILPHLSLVPGTSFPQIIIFLLSCHSCDCVYMHTHMCICVYILFNPDLHTFFSLTSPYFSFLYSSPFDFVLIEIEGYWGKLILPEGSRLNSFLPMKPVCLVEEHVILFFWGYGRNLPFIRLSYCYRVCISPNTFKHDNILSQCQKVGHSYYT